MKLAFCLTLLFAFIISPLIGQDFINGSFENNSVVGCLYNQPDTSFNTKIYKVFAFGKALCGLSYTGEVDIQTTGCYITPQNGNWCLGLASDSSQTNSDAISMELTTNLIVNQNYEVSFYAFGNSTYTFLTAGVIKLGSSNTNSAFGTLIYTCTPQLSNWKKFSFYFTATNNDKYITLTLAPGILSWIQVDNFTINNVTGNNENELNTTRGAFPNPFSTSTLLKFDFFLTNATLSLYNTSGKLIRQINNVFGNSTCFYRDGLKSGIYIMQITQDNKMIQREKIIIVDN